MCNKVPFLKTLTLIYETQNCDSRPASQHTFLVWPVVAFKYAYTYIINLQVILAASLVSFMSYLLTYFLNLNSNKIPHISDKSIIKISTTFLKVLFCLPHETNSYVSGKFKRKFFVIIY